jgi:hypothetical protein
MHLPAQHAANAKTLYEILPPTTTLRHAIVSAGNIASILPDLGRCRWLKRPIAAV